MQNRPLTSAINTNKTPKSYPITTITAWHTHSLCSCQILNSICMNIFRVNRHFCIWVLMDWHIGREQTLPLQLDYNSKRMSIDFKSLVKYLSMTDDMALQICFLILAFRWHCMVSLTLAVVDSLHSHYDAHRILTWLFSLIDRYGTMDWQKKITSLHTIKMDIMVWLWRKITCFSGYNIAFDQWLLYLSYGTVSHSAPRWDDGTGHTYSWLFIP